ncbi:MAG: hypothetical protein AB199_00680 [Parcubacteria bacterium C7867-004]|nr:MAG: hypothetical protein AB199_00680 [Parcubacteria bacterium C7867-004]
MKMAALVLVLILLALIAKWAIPFYQTVQISKKLIEAAEPYRNEVGDYRKPMLVLGDSTAVGVGAGSPEESVPALVAAQIGATNVENYAVSGAFVGNLPAQIEQARAPHYALILIQVGANNIVRFSNATSTAQKLGAILDTLPSTSKVVILTAGDVGGATLWPVPLRPIYTKLTIAYNEVFGKTAAARDMIYVNLYEDPSRQIITNDPQTYLAADGFHPSSEGYRLWFEAIRPHL